MAKEKERESRGKADDDLNVDEVAEGTDAEIQVAPQAPASPVANLLKSRLVKILGYALIAILLIIVSVLISLWVQSQSKRTERQLSLQDQRYEEKKPEPKAIYSLGEFKINTADKDETHFLKLTVYLGYENTKREKQTMPSELNERKVELQALVQEILMAKTKSELDEPGELEQLKEEIMGRVNGVLINGEVKEVFLVDYSVM
jgi:flagellar FliL protein